jgi:hypothetical protein
MNRTTSFSFKNGGGGGGITAFFFTMVARLFLTQYTKKRENIPNCHNITKLPQYYQTAINYTKLQ